MRIKLCIIANYNIIIKVIYISVMNFATMSKRNFGNWNSLSETTYFWIFTSISIDCKLWIFVQKKRGKVSIHL